MKKLLLLANIFTLFFLSSCSIDNNEEIIDINFYNRIKEVSASAIFEIGRNSKGCRKLGICTKKPPKLKLEVKLEPRSSGDFNEIDEKIKKAFERLDLNENEFNTFVKYDGDNVFFYLDDANYNAILSYTGKTDYIVEEDFTFSFEEILLTEFTVKNDNYLIDYDNFLGLYFIKF